MDTRIPCYKKKPVYGHSGEISEMWVSLIEKAFAKTRGCYERLNGGNTSEAMVDLTGGVSEKFNLNVIEPDDNFWK